MEGKSPASHNRIMSQISRPITRLKPIAEKIEQRVLYAADPIGAPIVNDIGEVSVISDTAIENQQMTELMVIDTRVPDHESLIADLTAQQNAGRSLSILVISPDDNALVRIGELISQVYQNQGQSFNAIHIISHGGNEQLILGSQPINFATVQENAADIAQWSRYLSSNADLRLYGCDFGQSERAMATINALASLTGADVAASNDITGHMSLQGNWTLEVSTGTQETTSLFSAKTQEIWLNILAPQPATLSSIVEVTDADFTNLEFEQTDTSVRTVENANHVSFTAYIEVSGANLTARQNTEFSIRTAAGVLISAGYLEALDSSLQNLLEGASTSDLTVALLDNGNFAVAWVASTSGQTVLAWAVINESGAVVSTQAWNITGQSINNLSIAGQSENKMALSYLASESGANSLRMSVFDNNSITPSSTVLHYRYNLGPAQAGVSASIDYLNGSTFVIAVNTVSLGPIGATNLRAFAIDIDQLDKSTTEGFNPRFDYSPSSITIWDIATSPGGTTVTGRALGIQTPQVVSMSGNAFAVIWSETVSGVIGTAAENVYGVTINSDLINISATEVINSRDRWHLDAVRAVWDNANAQLLVAWSYGGPTQSGIAYRRLNDQLQTVDGSPDMSTIAAPAGEQYYLIGAGLTDGVGVLSFQAMPDMDGGTAPPETNRIKNAYIAYGVGSLVVTQPPIAYSDSLYPIRFSLDREPNAEVTLIFDGIASLTFTPANWNQPQLLLLNISGPPGIETHSLAFSSADSRFSSITSMTVNRETVPKILVVDTSSDAAANDSGATTVAELLYNRGADGKISLREAIRAFNGTSNNDSLNPNTIQFALPVSDSLISLQAALPSITQRVVINGQLDPQNNVSLIGLDLGSHGLEIAAGGEGSEIAHLNIGGFDKNGILVQADNVTIRDNNIGFLLSNGIAQIMANGQSNIYIGGNAGFYNGVNIVGNKLAASKNGIVVQNAYSADIRNNQIGLIDGLGANAGHSQNGILLQGITPNTKIHDNQIGYNGFGTDTSGLTVLSGSGITLDGTAVNSTQIYRNWIGTNAARTIAAGNALDGISIRYGATRTQIGGDTSGDQNFIEYNNFNGIHIYSVAGAPAQSIGNSILINTIQNNAQIRGGAIPVSGAVLYRAVELSSIALAGDIRNEAGWNTTAQQDANDADTGSNNLLNSLDPLDSNTNQAIWTAHQVPGALVVSGTYHGVPYSRVRIDIYTYDANSYDPEMGQWAGVFELTLNPEGQAQFNQSLLGVAFDPAIQKLTAVLTEITSVSGEANTYGSSSRTSLGIATDQGPPILQFAPGAQTTVPENQVVVYDLVLAGGLNWSEVTTAVVSGVSDSAYFSLDSSATGTKLIFGPANYEGDFTIYGSHQYTVTLAVTDKFGRQSTTSLVINVSDVQETGSLIFTPGINYENAVIRFNGNNSLILSEPAGLNATYEFSLANGSTLNLLRNATSSPAQTLLFTGTIESINSQLTQLELLLPINSYSLQQLFFDLRETAAPLPLSSGTLPFNITQINQPLAVAPQTVNVTEGTSVTLTQAMFGVTDRETAADAFVYEIPAGAFAGLGSAGTLKINGVTAVAGAQFTGADLAANRVQYFAAANNTNNQSIAFIIRDTEVNGTVNSLLFNLDINVVPSSAFGPQIDTSRLPTTIVENSRAPLTFNVTGNQLLLNNGLSGPDAGLFSYSLNADGSGSLTLINPLDFETSLSAAGNKTFEVALTVTDSVGRTGSATYIFNIGNVNEPTLLTVEPATNPNTLQEESPIFLNGITAPKIGFVDTDLDSSFRVVTVQVEVQNAGFGTEFASFAGVNVDRFVFNPFTGSQSIDVAGSIEAITSFLQNMQFSPTPNYAGNVNFKLTLFAPGSAVTSTSFAVALTPVPDPLALSDSRFSVTQADIFVLNNPSAFAYTVDQNPAGLTLMLSEPIPQGRLIWLDGGILEPQELKAGQIFTYGDLIGGKIGYQNLSFETAIDTVVLTSLDLNGVAFTSAILTLDIIANDRVVPSFANLGDVNLLEGQIASWAFQVKTDLAVGLDSVQLLGSDAERFSVSYTADGNAVLMFNTAANFERFEASDGTNIFNVRVLVADRAGRQNEQTVRLTIQDLNEAASLTGRVGPAGLEDSLIRMDPTGLRQITLTDPDLTPSIQQITLSLSHASTTLSPVAGLSFSGVLGNPGAATQWSVTGDVNLLKNYLANLTLTPDQDYFGIIGLDLSVTDLTAKTAAPPVSLHLDFTVESVNDQPAVVVQASSLVESSLIILTASTLNATDVEDSPSNLIFELTSAPILGQITIGGRALLEGERFNQAQLDAGLIAYKHESAGSGLDTAKFSAIDTQGSRSESQSMVFNVSRAVVVQTTSNNSSVLTQAPLVEQVGPASVPTTTVINSNSSAPASANSESSSSRSFSGRDQTTDKVAVAPDAAQTNIARAGSEPNQSFGQASNRSSEVLSGTNRESDTSSKSSIGQTVRQAEVGIRPLTNILPAEQQIQLDKARLLFKAQAFQSDMKQMREEVNQGIKLEQAVVTSTVAVSTGVSIGYVIWLLRGGVLISSLLASVPAWRSFDPLPILATASGKDKEGEDDSLENLLEKARKTLRLHNGPKAPENTKRLTTEPESAL
jgi:hypothetical protein